MSRYEPLIFDSSLRELLVGRNVDELKKLLPLIPDVHLKAPRKIEILDAITNYLLGPDLNGLWNRLKPLEQSAVAEAVGEPDGIFDPRAFHAKYGALPVFETEGRHQWDRIPSLLRLFIHSAVGGGAFIPRDLRQKLKAFVPKPSPAQLASLEQIPACPPRVRNCTTSTPCSARLYTRHTKPL
jgi:hypothetical protein